ncbi:MAG: 4-(cytidine 5'-diphospho)-2-C-methyl-D-erythritol kinase [Yoonia sp.]|uniref:4-(cytidine 5'-diphospho)-2-C-methyl-D-erythritol kinase n=1 Tax=Yoonia sp. TaxID=2212373 RepID=UPI003EF14153
MKRIETNAPAKINLTLHVTGQRDDGYHLLDSLVVFADVADVVSVAPASEVSLTVGGPFAAGVPINRSNLIMRAADEMQCLRGVHTGAALTLEKNLPHAAGIGSGSSDAAATLKLLSDFWEVPLMAHDAPEVLALGADVPVCLAGPAPVRMQGIGEVLSKVPPLPACAMVLVRPMVDVPTGAVFQGLADKNGAPMAAVPQMADLDDLAQWLRDQRNDLQDPALACAPQIADVIDAMQAQPQVAFAGMSGSGATCFALVKDMADAEAVAEAMQGIDPAWWIAPAKML